VHPAEGTAGGTDNKGTRSGTHRTYDPQMRMPHHPGRHGPRLRDRHPAPHDRASGDEVTS
jgi:hypothetical protein